MELLALCGIPLSFVKCVAGPLPSPSLCRCLVAQQAAVSYSNKIKELRKEMQSEKARHQSAENTLQLKLTQKVVSLCVVHVHMCMRMHA